MDPNQDFQHSMHQLVELLKKVILHLPFASQKDSPTGNQNDTGNVNVNFCFFNFLPMSHEELDEFEEIYDDLLMGQEDRHFHSELKTDLSIADLEFLKRNGIRF